MGIITFRPQRGGVEEAVVTEYPVVGSWLTSDVQTLNTGRRRVLPLLQDVVAGHRDSAEFGSNAYVVKFEAEMTEFHNEPMGTVDRAPTSVVHKALLEFIAHKLSNMAS
jgi:hypothetical protein